MSKHPDQAWLYPESPETGFDGPYSLNAKGTHLGRLPENDICLPFAAVSRQHVKFYQDRTGQWLVKDLGSSNGTLVNGVRAEDDVLLSEGDMIDVGRLRLLFSLQSPDHTKWHELIHQGDTSSIRIVAEEEALNTIISTRNSTNRHDFTPHSQQTVSDHDPLVSRLAALYRLSDVLRDSTNRDRILSSLLDLVFENLPADRAVILTCRENCDQLKPLIHRHRTPGMSPDFALSKTIIQKTVRERVAILSRDVQMDSRFSASESVVTADIRSAMCVPLAGKSKLLGILFLDTREKIKAFSEDDLAFVSAMATDAAMTLENLLLAEENLQQERLAAVGETIAGMAHNIKNIMQLSRGGVELMDRSIASGAHSDVATLWPIVKKSALRMQALSQEMLDFSRQAQPNIIECDLAHLLEEIAENFRTGNLHQSATLTLQLDPTVTRWQADHDGLCKALLNLLTNAADALAENGGGIIISTGLLEDRPVIVVADDGPGIPPDILPNVFRPFFSTKGSRGNGLGLSMVRKTMEDMGGTVDVESTPGKGTRFILLLPPRD